MTCIGYLRKIMACLFGLFIFLPSIADAQSLSRFGFYWSLTASRYTPELILWHLYSHVTHIAIRPAKGCSIDDSSYAALRNRYTFVAQAHAHAHGCKAVVALLRDGSLAHIGFPGAPKGCETYPCEGPAFVSFNDARSMREVVALALEKRLGGVMVFALHQEHAPNTADAYPLSSAINQTLEQRGH